MQILSKHITETGGLSIIYISENYAVHEETFPAEEVKFFMFNSRIISDDDEVNVNVPGIGRVDYIDFLQAVATNDFCEKILSTNTLLK